MMQESDSNAADDARIRRRSVADLARRLDPDRPHSEQVTQLALGLFDQLAKLHGMGAYERSLLEHAGRLHDVGWSIARKRHHKHAMHLIRQGGLAGFTPLEVSLIANIARYHRRAMPKARHAQFAALPDRFKRVVGDLAALLRVADGLDVTHQSIVQEVRASWDDQQITVEVVSLRPAAAERAKAESKADLMARQFGRRARFTQKLP
jgi:exopolyphosphatase/guanosine-5'-triphosphate,3'-diphosphate pyrophosphatase